MVKLKHFISRLTPYRIFIFIVLSNFLASIIYLMLTKGAVLDEYAILQGKDRFMDFFNHIRYVENPAETYYVIKDACFPPLAYVFYWILNRMLPTVQAVGTTAEYVQPYALLLYVVYVSILTVLLFYCLLKISDKLSSSKVLVLMLSFLVSHIYVFWIAERGNAAYLVTVLLLAFYLFKDSEKRYKRELALIFLAVAACFKIYPAIFGLVYLSEKRYKEALRLTAYGILLFFLPFTFFGGANAVIQFFKNQIGVQAGVSAANSSIYALCRLYIQNINAAVITAIIICILFFAAGISIVCASHIDSYKKYFLICAMMIFLPPWNGGYTRAYLLLPLIIFLNKEEENKPSDLMSAVLFGITFSLMTYNTEISGIEFGEYVIYFIMYIMTLFFLIQGIISIVKSASAKRRTRLLGTT